MKFQLSPQLLSELVSIRHDIHRHPELGFEEERTGDLIADFLSECDGIEIHRGLAKTGVVGILNGSKSKTGVGLRADIDALPIKEATGLPYASCREGIMHACGHDGHTTALLGAAKLLSEHRHEIPCRVVFIFQPAEEQLGGARVLCEEGLTERFGIAAVFGFHGWPGQKVGEVCIAEDTVMAASDRIEIDVFGKGAHASTPHLAADPILAGADIVKALMSIPVRRHDPKEPSVISVGVFQAGTKGNIIPDAARIVGTVRTLTPQSRAHLHELIKSTVECYAQAHGCTANVDTSKGYPPVINTPRERDLVRHVAGLLPDKNRCIYPFPPSLAGEDFSFYLEKVPGAFYFIGLGDTPALHNAKFDFNDEVLPTAVKMHCGIALKWATDESARA